MKEFINKIIFTICYIHQTTIITLAFMVFFL